MREPHQPPFVLPDEVFARAVLNSHAKPGVDCFCDTDIVHSADAVTGLIELADAGEINLRFRLSDPYLPRPRGMWALWLRVSTDTHDDVGICIDCHDAPEYFCPDALAACRLYYKSNLRQASYDAVPAEHRRKLRPFGPYLPCRPRRDRDVFLRWLGNASTKLRHTLFVSTKKRGVLQRLRVYYGELKRHRRYASRKTWCEYETPTDETRLADPPILFNPSCWDESEADSIRPMNEKRAELIVAMRREFGDRFVGGFRNYGPSVARYPEAVEPRLIPYEEYMRLLHASPVVIYVNGKWDCYSWRLAENFAAGKGMVSEPIPNDAGFPLDENVGIVPCGTNESMIEALKRIISSPDEMRRLSEKSHRAYAERMRPQVRMRRILNELLLSESAPTAADDAACVIGRTR